MRARQPRPAGFRELPPQSGERVFFVGDLHGQLTALQQILADIGFNIHRDRLISVGDLIDRGPDSPGCIALLEQPWFAACLGNHEWMFIAATLFDDLSMRQIHEENGGDWVADLPQAERERLAMLLWESCPLALQIRLGDLCVGITHNDVWQNHWPRFRRRAGARLINQVLWSRQRFLAASSGHGVAPVKGIDVVVSGHNTSRAPVWAANQVYIDTHWKSGHLTVMSDALLRCAVKGHTAGNGVFSLPCK